MPNGNENEVLIPDTSNCIGFPIQRYKLQVGGAAKGLGNYSTLPGAIEAGLRPRARAPNIFIHVWGDTDKRTYFLLPGDLTP